MADCTGKNTVQPLAAAEAGMAGVVVDVDVGDECGVGERCASGNWLDEERVI